jgi:hypothetical protein
MIVGEESADEGTISVPRKMSIGYFRPDVEEMSVAGMYEESRVLPTPDGKSYVASYRQQLSDLFLVDGVQ